MLHGNWKGATWCLIELIRNCDVTRFGDSSVSSQSIGVEYFIRWHDDVCFPSKLYSGLRIQQIVVIYLGFLHFEGYHLYINPYYSRINQFYPSDDSYLHNCPI